MDIFYITEKKQINNSIEEYEFHEYTPVTTTNLNNSGEIEISIEAQALYTHPSESFVVFEGKLVNNADETAYANADDAYKYCHDASFQQHQIQAFRIRNRIPFSSRSSNNNAHAVKILRGFSKESRVLTNFDSKILIQQCILKITLVLQLDKTSLVKSQAQKDCSVSQFH